MGNQDLNQMQKIYISVLLIVLAVSSYTNARRMMKDEPAVTDINELLMLNSCSKGNHWVSGYWSGSGYNRHWVQGRCASNRDNCKKYDASSHNCKKCNWGYNLDKDQRQGHHCRITWWLVLLYVVAGIVGFCVVAVVLMAICGCICPKGKRYKRGSSSSSSSSSSRSSH